MSENTNLLLWQQGNVTSFRPESSAHEPGSVVGGARLGDNDGSETARATGEAVAGCGKNQIVKAALCHLAARSTPEEQAATVDMLPLVVQTDRSVERVLS